MDYAAVARKALNKIAKYGSAMTLTKKASAPVMNQDTGEFTGPSGADYAVTGLELSFGETSRWWPEAEVRGGDRMFLVAASGLAVVPAPGDTLTKGSDALSVASVSAIAPGGTDLLYRVLGRP